MEGSVTLEPGDWTLIENIPVTVHVFLDIGLENDQVYSYYMSALDIYSRESLGLDDGAINLNFIEVTPKSEGILTAPEDLQLALTAENRILVVWDSLLEEFDGFTIYRSIGNLYRWESIATVDRTVFSYTDVELPLDDGTTFY